MRLGVEIMIAIRRCLLAWLLFMRFHALFGEGTLAQADKFFATFDENHIIGGGEIIVLSGPRILDPD